MRIALYILIFCLTFQFSDAQTPYIGGSGDGSAMSELKFESTNGINQQLSRLTVYPTVLKTSSFLTIIDVEQIQLIYLVDAKGNRFCLNAKPYCSIPDNLQSGIYTLIISNNEKLYYSKIVIIDA